MVTEVGQQAAVKLALASGAKAAAKPEPARAAESVDAGLPVSGNSMPPQAAKAESDPAQLKELVSNLNEMVQSVHRELKFSVDEDTGRTVIRVINSDTEEVIRQIPPDEILAIARNFTGSEGLLLNTKV